MIFDTIHQALISHTGEYAFENREAQFVHHCFPILNQSPVVYMYTVTYWGDPAQLNQIVR